MKIIYLFTFIMLFNLTARGEVSAEVDKTYKDIEQTLGSVPSFFKDIPDSGISGAWEDMKGIQLNANTAIPPKFKELIGLAVAAQVPCAYCAYFHTKVLGLYQATIEEQNEAIALAATVRRWSTMLNGTQANLNDFKNDVDKMFSAVDKSKNRQAMEESARPVVTSILTPKDAYKDIERTIGFVPDYLKNYPQDGIVGVWKEMKGVELNPDTAIPGKYKDLIQLAVAAQTPCDYCVYFHTQSALFKGASKEELQEAVAMAGITRHWSTVLNGKDRDFKTFKGEVDQVMNHLKSGAKKTTQR